MDYVRDVSVFCFTVCSFFVSDSLSSFLFGRICRNRETKKRSEDGPVLKQVALDGDGEIGRSEGGEERDGKQIRPPMPPDTAI